MAPAGGTEESESVGTPAGDDGVAAQLWREHRAAADALLEAGFVREMALGTLPLRCFQVPKTLDQSSHKRTSTSVFLL